MPHSGRMRLIDRVVSYDEHRIVCESETHRARDHPLSINGVLPIACGLEYGAQAMAIHGTLLARMSARGEHQRARQGWLVSASDLRWTVSRLDQCAAPLVIEAINDLQSSDQVAYRFELRNAEGMLMSGRAIVFLGA